MISDFTDNEFIESEEETETESESEEETETESEEETQEPKKYELLDDCWNIVKEFAGIYNLTTKWYKLEKLSVEKAHDIFKQYVNRRLTYYKRDTLGSKKIIYKQLFTNFKSFKLMSDLNDLLNPKKDTSFLEGFKVGDEVKYTRGTGYSSRLGKIVKINKSSVSWSAYEVSVNYSTPFDDITGFQEKKYYYDKSKLMRAKMIKSFSVPIDPNDFIYYM